MIITVSEAPDGSGPFTTHEWPDRRVVAQLTVLLEEHADNHMFTFCREGDTYVNLT